MCLLTLEAVALTPIGKNMLELISSFDQQPDNSTSWKTM